MSILLTSPNLVAPMSAAAKLALTASGGFLMTGLLVGIWKYQLMAKGPEHRSRVYVDIAHRAALMYSFACAVMMLLVERSPYSPRVQLAATAIPIVFFAAAVASYLWHARNDRQQTQFDTRNFFTTWGMALLILGEIGGIGVLVWGFVSAEVL